MMKLQLLIILTSALVQTGLALHRSPLFGGYAGGDPFDDGAYAVVPHVTGIDSLLIRHGDSIDGIQVVYALENGQNITSAYHGGRGGNVDLIQLADGEYIARIEGERRSGDTSVTQYLTSITLYTRNVQDAAVKVYGPFGNANGHEGDHVPFNLAGVVVGFYGRSGTYLDAIGFDIDVADFIYPFYRKTSLIGGNGGDAFDDTTFLPYFPIRIKTLVVRHGDNVDGIETTYVISSGSLRVIGHGALRNKTATVSKTKNLNDTKNNTAPGKNCTISSPLAVDTRIDLDDDERIMRADIATGIHNLKFVQYLKLYTANSKGSERIYGPFGTKPDGGEVVTIYGVINGFFGREGQWMDSLGFYN